MVEVLYPGESRLMVLNVMTDGLPFDLTKFKRVFVFLKSVTGEKFVVLPHGKSNLKCGIIYWDITPEITEKTSSFVGRLVVEDNSGNYFVLRSRYTGDKFQIVVKDSAEADIQEIINTAEVGGVE